MTTLVNTDPVNHAQTIANVFSTLLKVHGAIDAHNLERKIYHLVLLRASQINGCGYCVEMHTKEAREDGETNARLDRLVVWEHVDDFTPRERAAFA
ncbi:carboxymuconolactone decarboxylase family protein, partial [Serratia bockelmannii]|nr:carboxymuconolactone decarboxylase family protein [Serratia bockelmannii]